MWSRHIFLRAGLTPKNYGHLGFTQAADKLPNGNGIDWLYWWTDGQTWCNANAACYMSLRGPHNNHEIITNVRLQRMKPKWAVSEWRTSPWSHCTSQLTGTAPWPALVTTICRATPMIQHTTLSVDYRILLSQWRHQRHVAAAVTVSSLTALSLLYC